MPAKAKAAAVAASVAKSIPTTYPLRAGLIDIGVNLTDGMYKGYYHHSSTQSHESDLDLVVDRAAAMGVVGLIITGGSLKESQEAVDLAIAQNRRLSGIAAATASSSSSSSSSPPSLRCYATVGCHPTRTCEMKKDMKGYMEGLSSIISKHSVRNLTSLSSAATEKKQSAASNDDVTTSSAATGSSAAAAAKEAPSSSLIDPDSCVVVAIGECGLDYDRLHFTGKEQQLVGFEAQFALAQEFKLPMFLHDRNTGTDFSDLMKKYKKDVLDVCGGGVVHSFTGDLKHLQEMLDLNLYIGINGCSMKTAENLEVVRAVPLNRLMLETDGPWCEIRKTHDSYQYLAESPADLQMSAMFQYCKKEKFAMGQLVKSRYEPVQMIEVHEVVYQMRKEEKEIGNDREALAAIVRKNTEAVFPIAFSSSK